MKRSRSRSQKQLCAMKKKPRALSARAAWNCEQALEERCCCRCGGKLHGAKRAFVSRNDPHATAFYCPTCGQSLTDSTRQRVLAGEKARRRK